jgi:ribosomal protein S18 acetylase RimI-like enzyme
MGWRSCVGQQMQLQLTVRDLEPEDLTDLDWSGGNEHLGAVAEALQACYSGGVALVVVTLPNGRVIASGGVDFRPVLGAGALWMLAVHESFQGMGIGTLLISSLEDRVRDRGLALARLRVEHDNPRAAALYRRLGYREVGSGLDSWPVAGGFSFVTVCTVLERDLSPSASPGS